MTRLLSTRLTALVLSLAGLLHPRPVQAQSCTAPSFSRADWAMAPGTRATAVADFDQDGDLDVATADFSIGPPGSVSVRLNDGAGALPTVAPGSPFAAGTAPFHLVAADFNHDGRPDLAVADLNVPANRVMVLLNNGNWLVGGFNAPLATAVFNGARVVAVADFDLDGNPDLAVATNSDRVSIRLGVGNGTFTPPTTPEVMVGSIPYGLVTGDFNRDGRPDLAAAVDQGALDYVIWRYGDGAGGFGPANTVAISASGTHSVDFLATADFNRDGRLDLAVTSNDFALPQFGVVVLKGNLTGGFDPPLAADFFSTGTYAAALAVGDFNHDGVLDLAAPNADQPSPPGITALLLGNGAGGFGAPFPEPADAGPSGAATGDLDRDGRDDLVVANAGPGNVRVHLNNFQTGALACPATSFGPAARVFDTGGQTPVAVAQGQFDGPGTEPDLVVAHFDSNDVGVLRGAGFGGFLPATVWGMGTNPRHVAVGSFNGDPNADLAVANFGDGTVDFLFGDGAGNFPAGNGFPVGVNPAFVEPADFDADGNLDLAVANNGSGTVSILMGDGTGFFTSLPAVVLAGSAPAGIARGDWNADGRIDLAVADYLQDRCWILLGDGTGGFSPTFVNLAAASGPVSLVAADFDGDGDLDLASANNGSGDVSILRGNGAGAFVVASSVAAGNSPQALTRGDFNRDGRLDLAVANTGDGTISILDGDGLGGFASSATLLASGSPIDVIAGDFDHNGLLDLAIATGQNVVILPGESTGGFGVAPRYSTGPSIPRSVTVADFDRDGILDLAVPKVSTDQVALLRGLAGGTFSAPVDFATASGPQHGAAGDFDLDGDLDLAVAANSGFVSILANNGSGAFSAPTDLPVGGGPARHVGVADFDEDGDLDLAVAAGSAGSSVVRIFRNGPPGTFTFSTDLAGLTTPSFVATGDFNGDSDPDLAVANLDASTVSIFLGTNVVGDDSFVPGGVFPTGPRPVAIAVADFDGDGDDDLAVANQNAIGVAGSVSLFAWTGLTFVAAGTVPAGYAPSGVVAADFNGDGNADLALAERDDNGVSILRGDGLLGFPSKRRFGVAGPPLWVAAGDFDRDGKPDVVANAFTTNQVSILLNTNCRARRMAMATEPSSCDLPPSPLLVQPRVQVLDDGSNLLQCEGGTVIASLLGGPGTLGGNPTRVVPTGALGGTADYGMGGAPLSVSAGGRGYRLRFAHAPSGIEARSRSFSQAVGVTISGPTTFCETGSAFFTSPLGFDRYEWRLDGSLVSTLPSAMLSGLSGGPHNLDLIVEQDTCPAFDTEILNVEPVLSALTISVGGTTTVCQATGCFGGTATETHAGGGVLTYQWGFRIASGPTEPVTPIPGQTAATYLLHGPDFPGPGTYFLVLTATPTCGTPQVSNEVMITVDNTLPADTVRFFTVTSTHVRNELEWVNPPLYGRVMIRFDSGPTSCSFPPTEASGTLLVDQTGPVGGRDSFPHTASIVNTHHYCYSIFVDKGGGGSGPYSARRSVEGRPFDSTTGPTRWATSMGTATLAPPGVGSGGIHVAANDSALHAMRKGVGGGTWPPLWKPVRLDGPSQGRPSTVPMALGSATRVVFLGSQDGHVYAFDADTGDPVAPWTPAPFLGAMVQAGPSGIFTMFGGAYDYILVGTRDSAGDNRFYVLNVADGTSALPPVDGSGVTDFGRIGIISGQASVDYAGRRVYFTSYARGAAPNDRTVWSVNLDDGTVVWAQAYGDIAAGPTLNGDGTRLYVGTNTGEVKALDTSDGTVAWSYPTGDGPVKGFVFFDRFSLTNDLYFATTGTLWSIADSGGTPPTFRWSRTLDSPSTPVFLRGPNHVYVGLGDGTLHRLNSADGSDAPGIPVTFPLTLGDGSANVGSPTIDIVGGFLYVGTVGGVVYAVELIP